MTTFPVEIEDVFTVHGSKVVVLARWLAESHFDHLRGATLGGCPIEPSFDIPRAIDAVGRPRLDLFAFSLSNTEDQAFFTRGQRVELVAAGG